MQLTHSIALDFGRDTLPITIFAKQYDKESRFVEIVPLECGKDYTLESGVTARLQLTKPDGHTVLKTATIATALSKLSSRSRRSPSRVLPLRKSGFTRATPF